MTIASGDIVSSPLAVTVSPAEAIVEVWEQYTPMATIGRDTTSVISGLFYGSSFGSVRILDGGRGCSYRYSASVEGVEWIVGRVR